MKIKINNVELDIVIVNGRRDFLKGVTRDILEFQFNREKTTIDELEHFFENSKILELIENGETVGIHDNYTIEGDIVIKDIVISPESINGNGIIPEVTEKRLIVIRGQMTVAEKQNELLINRINEQENALIELASLLV